MDLCFQRTTVLLNKYDIEKSLQTNLTSWIVENSHHSNDNFHREEEWDLELRLIHSNNTQQLDTARQSIQKTITEWLKSWGN